jgi:hypothetical protein
VWHAQIRAEFEARRNDDAVRRRFDPREHQKAVDARNSLAASTAESFLKVQRSWAARELHVSWPYVQLGPGAAQRQRCRQLEALRQHENQQPESNLFAVQDYTLGDINPAAPDFNQGNGPAAEEAAAGGALAEQAAVSPAAEVWLCAHSSCIMDTVTNQTTQVCEPLQPADMAHTLRLFLRSAFMPHSAQQCSCMLWQGGSPTSQPGSARKQPGSARSAKPAPIPKVAPEVTWQVMLDPALQQQQQLPPFVPTLI